MKTHHEDGCVWSSSTGKRSDNWSKINCDDCLEQRKNKDISVLCFVSETLVSGNFLKQIKKDKNFDLNKKSRFFKGVFGVLEDVLEQVDKLKNPKRVNKLWDISKLLRKKNGEFNQAAGWHIQGAIGSYDFSVAKQKLKDRHGGSIPDGSWVLEEDFPKRS